MQQKSGPSRVQLLDRRPDSRADILGNSGLAWASLGAERWGLRVGSSAPGTQSLYPGDVGERGVDTPLPRYTGRLTPQPILATLNHWFQSLGWRI